MSVSGTSAPASHKKNRPASLNKRLDHKLFVYATAASAAGVAAMSLAQPCQAEIIYTKAHQYIDPNSSYSLDLNNDGITDFTITNSRSYIRSGAHVLYSQNLGVHGAGTNKVWDNFNPNSSASAMQFGQIVGPGSRFLGSGRMDKCKATHSSYYLSGSWGNTTWRFLGFSFSINGQTHYGWARLTTTIRVGKCKSTALLTGYAYETIPGKSIEAGRQQGKDVNEADEPAATLGRLALGNVQSGRPDAGGDGK